MKAIEFKGVNARLGENQPEYVTLPVMRDPGPEGMVTACFQLDEEERLAAFKDGIIWLKMMTFGHRLPPVLLQVEGAEKELVEDVPAALRFGFSWNEERFEGVFDSREDAAAEAFAQHPERNHVFVGQLVVPDREPDAESVIEQVAERTTLAAGDWADDYLWNVPEAMKLDLQRRIQAAWNAWEAEHGLAPNWFNVTDVRMVKNGGGA